jgi:8-oxo-dGTP pyrophosphatase MutT (NUDIX family)
MQEYSVGFLHNDDEVVLIRKNRPEWQAGYLNGVGGHVELGEDPHDCIVREFFEETGVQIGPWYPFLTLEGPEAIIHCFSIYDRESRFIYKVNTMTDEAVEIWNMDALNRTDQFRSSNKTIPNLRWIIPLMRQAGNYEPVTVKFYSEA